MPKFRKYYLLKLLLGRCRAPPNIGSVIANERIWRVTVILASSSWITPLTKVSIPIKLAMIVCQWSCILCRSE